jgi:hypothetical protein
MNINNEHLSVRELIRLLKKCPDQDAWVVLNRDTYKYDSGSKMYCCEVEPKLHYAIVVLKGHEGVD